MRSAPHNRAIQAGSTPAAVDAPEVRRPGIERYIADVQRRFPQWSPLQVAARAKQEWEEDRRKKGGAA